MDVSPALNHYDISTSSANVAVQVVGEHVFDQQTCQVFMHKVFNTDLDRDFFPIGCPSDFFKTFAQAAVEVAIKQKCKVDDVEDLLALAHDRTERFMLDPSHQYFFAHDEGSKTAASQQVAVAEGIDVQVEVKSDGSLKKGAKGVLAEALFRKHMLEAATPLTNKQFVEILVKEAQMTKSGANTYAYNLKHKFADQLAAKQTVTA